MTTFAALQKRIGYTFKDEALLESALTHASAGGETDYQRLEFLGDRVLGLLVAEGLYALYPSEPEGDLSKRHTALVRGETMTKAARSIDLGKTIVISDAEELAGGRNNANILSDIMEAVIGAVYLDGGLEAARKILGPLLEEDLRAMTAPPRDPKTLLQEYTQAHGLGLPEYTLTSRDGPDHAPDFRVTVKIANGKTASASGPSKRAAEKAAAQTLIEALGIA
ncbi:MAG: ribonuclease III [Alphaproteobacteria bacterium]|nr:ribonuclease III [Alphaproteobacteria bacterium]